MLFYFFASQFARAKQIIQKQKSIFLTGKSATSNLSIIVLSALSKQARSTLANVFSISHPWPFRSSLFGSSLWVAAPLHTLRAAWQNFLFEDTSRTLCQRCVSSAGDEHLLSATERRYIWVYDLALLWMCLTLIVITSWVKIASTAQVISTFWWEGPYPLGQNQLAIGTNFEAGGHFSGNW